MTLAVGKFQYEILAVIEAMGTPYGAEIVRELPGNPHPPQVYAALHKMERRNLISSWLDKTESRRGRGKLKRRYRIDIAGERVLEALEMIA